MSPGFRAPSRVPLRVRLRLEVSRVPPGFPQGSGSVVGMEGREQPVESG